LIFMAQGCRRATSKAGQREATETPVQGNGEKRNTRAPLREAHGQMVFIRGGEFLVGTDGRMHFEDPAHRVAVRSF